MTECVRFNKAEHNLQLQAWCIARRKRKIPDHWMSDTGWIVPGVIAAFLYRDPSCGLAFVECVISNPNTTHEQRQHGLDLMDQAWTQYAREHGIRVIQGQTAIATVAKASERNAWTVSRQDYRILIKLIGDNIE